jgi:hypothetical protein
MMESVKAPFSTSVGMFIIFVVDKRLFKQLLGAEMFTVFPESLCSGLEANSESDVYGGGLRCPRNSTGTYALNLKDAILPHQRQN